MFYLQWMVGVHGNGIIWITLLDISDRSNPTFSGRWEEAENRLPYGIVFGPPGSNLLYAAMPPAGLWVLDISNPAAIAPVGIYQDFGTDFIFDIELLGNYVFMADNVQGVTAVNISNPNLPVFIAYLAADTFWGLVRIDVSNTASPAFINVIATPGNASKVDASDDYLIMTDRDAGVGSNAGCRRPHIFEWL